MEVATFSMNSADFFERDAFLAKLVPGSVE